MKIACVLILVCSADASQLAEVRERGAKLELDGQWAAAARLYETVLEQMDALEPASNRFWVLTSLGEMSFNQGEYNRTRNWLRLAEDAIEGCPEDRLDRIRLMNFKGALYLAEGKLSAAAPELSRAAKLAGDLDPKPLRAAIFHNLASLEMQTGQFEPASRHQLSALELWLTQFGEDDERVTRARVTLSSIQALSGDWRAAEPPLLQIISVTATPEALSNYAVVLDHLHRRKAAREIRKRIPEHAGAGQTATVDLKALLEERRQSKARAR